ncbi:PAAR domain-containing protein [Burkholderia sp.]|uniref:PAAR domain-containing protein n=1 Tax=Burkholderia sp. TaxID=36773 RepID=UPI00258CDD09|nr:PAAR domain-containing protein [Burkholderia sp.]MCL4635720.1 PAAR domain-containing protein [Burkholderia sp.]
MKWFYLKKGDRSLNGGVVLEDMDFFMDHGTPVTFLGAKVSCSACESAVVIFGQGLRRPDSLMGKHATLEGDLCAYCCRPNRVTWASQDTASMEFARGALAELGVCPAGKPLPERRLESCDGRVRFVGRDGKPLSGVCYHIRIASGVTYKRLTDSEGRCPRVHTDTPQQRDIAIGFQALQR